MDGKQLDALSRAVGNAATRRGMLAVLGGALLGGGLGRAEEAEAGIPIVGCKVPGKQCKKKQDCCSGRCKQKRCQCSARGRACWNPLEGALCCSKRCANGKCS